MRILISCAVVFIMLVAGREVGWSQQFTVPQLNLRGGLGWIWMSQFANPALRGALYSTPLFPWTGYYPLYPGAFTQILPEEGILVGPVGLHPFFGAAEMFTDNVFRTTDKRSDFFHTLAPGIQAQVPFARRHVFVADYRTNIQYYQRTPSNNVQDQTASGRLQFNFANDLKLDLQGEHKLGHDPRGSAVDTQAVEVNKWTTDSFIGRALYTGGQIGAMLTVQSLRWNFLNNNQAIIRNEITNYAGLRVQGAVFPNTSALLDFGVRQDIYDQNKNLDSALYTVSTGARWEVTGSTAGEILIGYQFLKYTNAQINQPGPFLSAFQRDQDSFSSFFISGRLFWSPISQLTFTLQPYRAVQPVVVSGTSFYTATGVNLSGAYAVTERTDLIGNLGFERDDFSSPAGTTGVTPDRSDTLKNIAIGLNYRAVKWIGIGLQYIFEHRDSTIERFNYQANTFMVSAQTLF